MAEQRKGVIPHLVVDNAVAAIDFYVKGFGGRELMRMPAEDGRRLMHAEVEINGATVYLCDDFPERSGGQSRTPKALGRTPVSMHLDVPNCDEAVTRAVAAGAKCVMGPMDAFWGARFAHIVDPFGHEWSFSHPLAK